MAKKRYTMVLDSEEMDKLYAWLKPKGLTISGYFNSILHENMQVIRTLEGVDDLKDLTIGKLTQLYAGMAGELQKSKEDKKVKKVKQK